MNPDPTSLERLHDIIVPEPVPWWPPAPGWYWLLGAVFVGLLLLMLRLVIWWQQNAYRREALAELARLEKMLGYPSKQASALTVFAELLKRTALSVWPRAQVASLTGAAWVHFLNRSAHTEPPFIETVERVAYDPGMVNNLSEREVDELTAQVRDWLKHHRLDTADADQQ